MMIQKITYIFFALSILNTTSICQEDIKKVTFRSINNNILRDFRIDSFGIDSVILNEIISKKKIWKNDSHFYQFAIDHKINDDTLILISKDFNYYYTGEPDIVYRLFIKNTEINKFILNKKFLIVRGFTIPYSAPPYRDFANNFQKQTGCPKKCVRLFNKEVKINIINGQYIEIELKEPEQTKVRRKVIYSELKTKKILKHVDSFSNIDTDPIELDQFRFYCNCKKN